MCNDLMCKYQNHNGDCRFPGSRLPFDAACKIEEQEELDELENELEEEEAA